MEQEESKFRPLYVITHHRASEIFAVVDGIALNALAIMKEAKNILLMFLWLLPIVTYNMRLFP